ncbi:MAG: hypothetical protein ACKO7P_13105 [Bacteroidota bacterium]
MRTVGKVKINNQTNGYLIHGQPFNLQFIFPNVKWGLVFYRPGSMSANYHNTRNYRPGSSIFGSTVKSSLFFRIIKGDDQINFTSNAYYPYVQFYLFSSFINIIPTKLRIPLKINFFNTKECDVDTDISMCTYLPSANPIAPKLKNLNHSISTLPNRIATRKSQMDLVSQKIATPKLQTIHHH